MPDYTNYTIDTLNSGDGLAEINAMIGQVQSALNSLSSRIDNLNSKSAVLRQHVPLATGVTVGTLVYYDTVNAEFAPALAKLRALPGEQGESIEDPMSRVEGMIIDLDSLGTSGTLLTGGCWESATAAQACLGVDAVAGTYYLSPTSAGHATLDPGGHLRQPVLSYYGSGRFSLSLFYLAHDNHFHSTVVVTGSWELASDLGDELGITPPTGAIYGYDHRDDVAFASFGEMSGDTTAIFYLGILQGSATFVIDQGFLWCKLTTAPVSGSVTLFNHFPFAYGSSALRTVESTSDALKVVMSNGTCRLTAANYISGATSKNALAVAALSGNTILYTPVITDAVNGPGINIVKDSRGTAIISASNILGSPVDAYSINHNGTVPASNGLFNFIMFPKSRISEFVMTLPVQDVADGGTVRAVAWATDAEAVGTLAVKMWFLPLPTGTLPTNIPSPAGDPDLVTTLALTGQAGKFTYSETADALDFSGSGLLVASVAVNSAPADDMRLLRVGFKMTAVEMAQSSSPSATPAETTQAVVLTGTAGESVNKYALVYVDSNGVIRTCTSQSVDLANACIGVAIASAASGEQVDYMVTGILQDPNFYASLGYTPAAGGPLYVGTTGVPTQADPSSTTAAKYIQKVGVALTGAALQIGLEPAIIKQD